MASDPSTAIDLRHAKRSKHASHLKHATHFKHATANPNPLANEQVTFIQNQLPGFDDGEYQLTVSQEVFDENDKIISDDSLTNSYTFGVLGDRFALANPANLIDSVFPPDNGTGEFTNVFPHVVFTQPTFPWSRYPTNKAPQPAPGADVPTWLAVLVFDEDDAITLAPATATCGDLFPTALYPKSDLDDNYSYFFKATSTTQLGLDLDETIQILDVPLDLFWQVAPTVADLSLMAHIREVSLINKMTAAGGMPTRKRVKLSDDGVPLGTYSIVFGNRLPQTEKKAFAYLVSLEGLQDLLPDSEQGGPPTGTFLPGKFLRLAVLKSWNFFSTGQSATFVAQLMALNGGSTDDSDLILPYSGSNAVVKDALQMGFAPMNHNLRTGGRTVSWYRGPLVPYKIDQQRVSIPVESPDEAMVFDPTMGMFDESYAAAWTLGRMLALQDTGFSTELYQWKQGLSQEVIQAIEDEILGQKFGELLERGPVPRALEGVDASSSRALLHKTIQALAPRE